MNGEYEIDIDKEDLAKISFSNAGKDLPIYGYSYLPNYIRQLQFTDKSYTSVAYSKGNHNNLKFHVVTDAEHDTPWGYEVIVPNVNLKKDTDFNFSDAIEGKLETLEELKDSYGNSALRINYSLSSGDFQVGSIYRALKRNDFALNAVDAKDTPIRDYQGLFNRMSNVSTNLILQMRMEKLYGKILKIYTRIIEIIS